MPQFSAQNRSITFTFFVTSNDLNEGKRCFSEIVAGFARSRPRILGGNMDVRTCIVQQAETYWPAFGFTQGVSTICQLCHIPSTNYPTLTWRIAKRMMDGLLFVAGDEPEKDIAFFERLSKEFQESSEKTGLVRVIVRDVPGRSQTFPLPDIFSCETFKHDGPATGFRAFFDLAGTAIRQAADHCTSRLAPAHPSGAKTSSLAAVPVAPHKTVIPPSANVDRTATTTLARSRILDAIGRFNKGEIADSARLLGHACNCAKSLQSEELRAIVRDTAKKLFLEPVEDLLARGEAARVSRRLDAALQLFVNTGESEDVDCIRADQARALVLQGRNYEASIAISPCSYYGARMWRRRCVEGIVQFRKNDSVALGTLVKAVDCCGEDEGDFLVFDAGVCLLQLYLAQGETAKARHCLNRMRRLALKLESPRLCAELRCCEALCIRATEDACTALGMLMIEEPVLEGLNARVFLVHNLLWQAWMLRNDFRKIKAGAQKRARALEIAAEDEFTASLHRGLRKALKRGVVESRAEA